MTVVTEKYGYVTGIDTHDRTHSCTALHACTGRSSTGGSGPCRVGKTDDIDATAAAVGLLIKDTTQLMYPRLMYPRAEGVRTAISGLLATRRRADHQRTGDTVEQRIAREDAVRLAAAVLHAGKLLKHNKEQLAELGEEPAPGCRTGPAWDL